MSTVNKAKQLRDHKALATGLFLLMLIVYTGMIWLSRSSDATWIGYVKAFSEAAMVGALADWFAVTALFHHPLGLPIPHTNLIEHSKKAIGDNLGSFVVNNFLTPGNIRPYIQQLRVSAYAAQWLEKERNKKLLIAEAARLVNDIVQKIDPDTVAGFMAKKGGDLLDSVQLNVVVGNALQFFLDKQEHEKLVTTLAGKIRQYIGENEDLVRDRVKSESYFFIPKFVDHKVADKITQGLMKYFGEIEQDPAHRLRAEVGRQLYDFVNRLKTEPKWEEEFRQLKNGLLSPEKMHEYALAAWASLKTSLQQELTQPDSALLRYCAKTIDEFVYNLKHDAGMQQKIDSWVRHNAYRYILRNTEKAGTLISNTVGNWQGRELSRKLELEVGKDLQFIRINGTIVGGLVGLLIHFLTSLFSGL